MLCKSPFVRGMHCFPCGQCMPCRFNRRRVWTHRIMLESLQHAENSFITLTYADEHLPEGGSLAPSEIQLWLKRLRKAVAPRLIRFYCVGEYGDDSRRPHYHAAIFGFGPCSNGNTRYRRGVQDCCANCDTVRNTWQRGGIFVGSLETQSAQYIAGYVVKKMTDKGDARLLGRHPEFCRMSRRPGIGYNAVPDIASALMEFNLDETQADVPVSLRHGPKQLPLGRYLRQKLREQIGKEKNAPEAVLLAQSEEMRPLLEAAKASSEVPSLKGQVVLANKGKVARFEGKQRIFKQGRRL